MYVFEIEYIDDNNKMQVFIEAEDEEVALEEFYSIFPNKKVTYIEYRDEL